MLEQEKLTLKEWLKKNKMSVLSIAKLLTCSPQTVHNWKAGRSHPHHLFKRKLLNITRNEIAI